MNSLALNLTALSFLVLAAVMAPNILAANRGKIMRNVAIWLAIFVALGTGYQMMHPQVPVVAPQPVKQGEPAVAPTHDNGDENKDFTPPKEE